MERRSQILIFGAISRRVRGAQVIGLTRSSSVHLGYITLLLSFLLPRMNLRLCRISLLCRNTIAIVSSN